jgi:hypothetical protein
MFSPEDLHRQKEYAHSRLLSGFKSNNSFDLLEAESVIERIGMIEPDDELRTLVLDFLKSDGYHEDFDRVRVCGYLDDDNIKSILEKRFSDLKEIWLEQDSIRLAESHQTALMYVTRRANELNTLKVAFDPYLKTLDDFFTKSFSQQRIGRFPQLAEIRDKLYHLREEGILSKDNILTIIEKARRNIEKLVARKLQELKNKYSDNLPKPNRLIALYYCLLECLLVQRSTEITINEEFLEKIGQDFRAAAGHGTKRFVLNTLLKFNHPGFSEIASEARFSIQPSVIEKLERKERGEAEWRLAKVDLNEVQVFELYRTASEVIAQNPTEDVFEVLLYTYAVPSLLMGLRALERAELAPLAKVNYLQRFFGLGTVNEYVFIRSVEVLTGIPSPAAKRELGKLLGSRYGWRKVIMPKTAFMLIKSGFEATLTPSEFMSLAEGLISKEMVADYEKGKEIHFPYDSKLYETAFDQIVMRIEKNPFHGLNEIALHQFFRHMLVFIAGSSVTFALKAKLKLLNILRTNWHYSAERREALEEEVKRAGEILSNRYTELEENEKAPLNALKRTLRTTALALKQIKFPYGELQTIAKELLASLLNFQRTRTLGELELAHVSQLIQTLYENGAYLMKTRQKNLERSAKKSGVQQHHLLPVRMPLTTSNIVRLADLLREYAISFNDQKAREVLVSCGVFNEYILPEPLPLIISEEETLELWRKNEIQLRNRPADSEILPKSKVVSSLCQGAVQNGLLEMLGQLVEIIYDSSQPETIRLSLLAVLPVNALYQQQWLYALARENEAVIATLRKGLSEQKLRKLQTLVPDLIDLFY